MIAERVREAVLKREVDLESGPSAGAMRSFVRLPCFRIVWLSLRLRGTRSRVSTPSHFAKHQLMV